MHIDEATLASLNREQLTPLLARAVRERIERNMRRKAMLSPDPWETYRGDPVRFITDGLQQCRGDDWRNWRTIFRAAYGQPLDSSEYEFFRSVAERDPPTRRVRELWLIIGRRGGKDSVASLMALYAGLYADCSMLRPGERALVACFATDRDQAGIVHGYIKGYFQTIPSLCTWLEGDLPDSYRTPVRLKHRVDVAVVTNNFKAPRGRPIACAIFDEVAFWKSEDSATPDAETYNAVMPGMASVPGAMLIGISSPHMQRGLLYDNWKRYYKTNDPNVLVIRAPTRVMNPVVDRINPGVIDRAYEDDPERARAEYGAEWRRDLADFVPREIVESLVVNGRYELPPLRNQQYRAFFDASGGTSDSMALAIAHRDGNRGVLDCIREQRPPFNPESTIADFAGVLKEYGVNIVEGDRYAGIWPTAEFAKNGILYKTSERSKSEIYLDLLPLLTSGRVELLDNQRMINQTCRLERRSVRAGRDTVDHPSGDHDDLANVMAGSLTLVTIDETQDLWSMADLA